jgi:hypothetical protein
LVKFTIINLFFFFFLVLGVTLSILLWPENLVDCCGVWLNMA